MYILPQLQQGCATAVLRLPWVKRNSAYIFKSRMETMVIVVHVQHPPCVLTGSVRRSFQDLKMHLRVSQNFHENPPVQARTTSCD